MNKLSLKQKIAAALLSVGILGAITFTIYQVKKNKQDSSSYGDTSGRRTNTNDGVTIPAGSTSKPDITETSKADGKHDQNKDEVKANDIKITKLEDGKSGNDALKVPGAGSSENDRTNNKKEPASPKPKETVKDSNLPLTGIPAVKEKDPLITDNNIPATLQQTLYLKLESYLTPLYRRIFRQLESQRGMESY